MKVRNMSVVCAQRWRDKDKAGARVTARARVSAMAGRRTPDVLFATMPNTRSESAMCVCRADGVLLLTRATWRTGKDAYAYQTYDVMDRVQKTTAVRGVCQRRRRE